MTSTNIGTCQMEEEGRFAHTGLAEESRVPGPIVETNAEALTAVTEDRSADDHDVGFTVGCRQIDGRLAFAPFDDRECRRPRDRRRRMPEGCDLFGRKKKPLLGTLSWLSLRAADCADTE